MYYIPNSKIYLKHVQLQYDIKFLWLFGFIYAQNSIGSLILYNGLNSIKSPQLFGFIWVKQNNLGLNLCIVPYMTHVVVISEDSLVRSYKERSKVYCYWYWRFSINFSQLLGCPFYSHILFSFCNSLKFGPCTHYNNICPFSPRFLTRTTSWLTLGLLIPL